MMATTGTASRLTRLMGSIMAIVSLWIGNGVLARQCDPVCPSGCPTVCDVTTQAELQAALDCFDASDGDDCSTIRVPLGTTLIVTSTINLEDVHSGLDLNIEGVVRGEGSVGTFNTLFNISNCDNLDVYGGGSITSAYEPSQQTNSLVATAFRIVNESNFVEIRDLAVSKMTDVIKVEAEGAENLTVVNVHGLNLGDYGIWLNANRMTAHLENCSMVTIDDEHPYRLYGEHVTVLNCSSHGSDKTGLWTPEGDDFRIDRFSSDKWLRFGPDNTASGAATLENFVARELHTTDYVRAEMGLQNACLVNLCGDLTVGRTASQVAHGLGLTDFKWDEVSSYTVVTTNTLVDYPETVNVVDYNYCFSDIDRDNAVGVSDLLAVITSWGSCPVPPSGYATPPPPCAGDISPTICGDNVVNVTDLLKVITDWGGCEAHPVCGPLAATDAGTPEDAPETINECWIEASNAYPNDEAKRNAAFEACVTALDELN